ncbi:MAG TPA: DUF6489 family protein [Thermoanaerobaculia bacterium]|nr:DUF6489 family protein [Thermoanaerobaculia bacterium]
MKIHLDIECTPAEARAFFGLPDVAPLQEAVMKELQERMLKNVRLMDPEAMFRTWMPLATQGVEDLRNLFSQATGRKRSSGAQGTE